MTHDTQNMAHMQAALDVLLMLDAIDLQDRHDVDATTAGLARIIRRRARESSTPKAAQEAVENIDLSEGAGDSSEGAFRYANMPISEVAVEILRAQPPKETMSLTKIVKVAKGGGYQFDGANPNNSARAAFVRRAENKGDLIQVSRTDWGLREWYTQREISSFRHSEITRAGLQAAKARGKAKTKSWAITAEQAATIKDRLENGDKLSHVARDYGLSTNTVSRYKKLLASWKSGDPFPPKPTNDDGKDGRPNLRTVEG